MGENSSKRNVVRTAVYAAILAATAILCISTGAVDLAKLKTNVAVDEEKGYELRLPAARLGGDHPGQILFQFRRKAHIYLKPPQRQGILLLEWSPGYFFCQRSCSR